MPLGCQEMRSGCLERRGGDRRWRCGGVQAGEPRMVVLSWILVGVLAGWVAGLIAGTNRRHGWRENISVGITGAMVGGVPRGANERRRRSMLATLGLTCITCHPFGVSLHASTMRRHALHKVHTVPGPLPGAMRVTDPYTASEVSIRRDYRDISGQTRNAPVPATAP
jgi:uncharacterized membrane protein YeaQ/YmgE (transglycosylase-associated protein family)